MRRLALACSVLIALTAAPAWALFSLSGFQNSMLEFLIDQLSTEGEFEITVDEVANADDGATTIRGLAIADGEGVWFTAEALDFAWDPSRLLRGEVEFNNLAMRGVEVLRQPVVPPSEDTEPVEPDDPNAPLIPEIAWPRSPLALRVDRLALDGVRLAEPVLGHAIAFDAEGSVRDEDDIQAADLTLTRTDAVPGQIAIDYTRNFSDGTLTLNLSADEGPEGLIAALSGLPSEAGSRLTLTAEGPPTDWRVALDLALAETIAVAGNAQVSYQGPLAVDARFTATPGARLDPDIAVLLGEQAELVARLSEGEDTRIDIAEARITSPDLNLRADGSYTRATAAADLAVDLDAGPRLAQPVDGVEFGGLTFAGRITGAPGSFAADGDLTLAGLATDPVDIGDAQLSVDLRQTTPEPATTLDADPDADPDADADTPTDTPAEAPEPETTTELTVAGQTRGLRLDRIAPDVIGDARLSLDLALTGTDLTLSEFALTSRPLTVRTSGTANIETTDADLTLTVSAPDLAPIAGAYGVEASGAIALDGTVARLDERTEIRADTRLTDFRHPAVEAEALTIAGLVTQEDDRVTFDVDGSGTEIRIDRIGPDLLPRATLVADGELQGDRLELERLDLVSPLLTTRVQGALDTAAQTGRIAYDVSTPDLGPVARLYEQQATGALSARGVALLTGADAPPRVDGQLGLSGLTYDGVAYGRVDLIHDVRVSEAPSGELTVTAEGSPYGPARIATGFAFDAPRLTLSGLDATALGVSARGDVEADIEGPAATGRIALSAPNLATLRPVTGTALGGALDGTVQLRAPGGRQDAEANLRLSNVAIDGTRLARADLAAQIADALGTPSIQADLRAAGLDADTLRLATARLTARGPLSRLDITADADGTLALNGEDRPLSVQTAARVDAATPTVRATVSRLEAALAEDRAVLNRPLAITARGGTVALRGLDLALPGAGRLAGDLTSYGGPLSGDITLDHPDLAVLNRLAGAPLTQGTLAATARFDTRRSQADITVEGRQVRFEGVEAGGALDLDARAGWQGRAADVEATVSGNFGDPLSLTATVPVARQGGLPALATRGPVSARVQWEGQIDRLWALVPASGHILTGAVDVDLGVAGDISEPDLTGDIRVSDGGYQNLDAGTILTDMTLATSLTPEGDLMLDLDASDGSTGTVSVEGSVALDASGIDLRADLDQAILLRRDDVLARIDGGLTVKGAMTDLAVEGDLTIAEAEVRLVNSNPPSIITLDDVRIKGEPVPETEEADSTVSLDIDIDAPGRLFVRGRGLDSEWQLALQVRGNAAQPRVTGRIERVRGRLDLVGKSFDLARGRVDFDGGRTIDPRIDVVLERDTGDLVGRIVVDGLASDPQLSFSSSPALPEDEVLPRTLFGTSSQALSGSQAISLALGLATLMDGGGGTLDRVRGAVGLDSLRIEEDDEGNAAVGLGKEVAEGVWVGTRQSLGSGDTSVAVEVEVFENIELDAEIEAGGDSSVGVKWKKDF